MNPFIGRSQDWLETKLELAQDALANGRRTISVSAGDTSATSEGEMSTLETIRMLLQALNLIDDELYPSADVTPITETRVIFR